MHTKTTHPALEDRSEYSDDPAIALLEVIQAAAGPGITIQELSNSNWFGDYTTTTQAINRLRSYNIIDTTKTTFLSEHRTLVFPGEKLLKTPANHTFITNTLLQPTTLF